MSRDYEPIQLLPGQVVYNDPDGLLQAQKEEQPKKTAPRSITKLIKESLSRQSAVGTQIVGYRYKPRRKVDSLSEWPGFQAVKR